MSREQLAAETMMAEDAAFEASQFAGQDAAFEAHNQANATADWADGQDVHMTSYARRFAAGAALT